MKGTLVEVRSAILEAGAARPTLAPVVLSLPSATITVRDLIAMAVEHQVAAARTARAQTLAEFDRQLRRQYLSQADLDAGGTAEIGKLAMPAESTRKKLTRPIDTDVEVRKALVGFEAGAFIVVAGGQQAKALDETLTLPFESTVTFLRLVPLQGG